MSKITQKELRKLIRQCYTQVINQEHNGYEGSDGGFIDTDTLQQQINNCIGFAVGSLWNKKEFYV